MKGISSKRLLEIANRIGDNQKLEQLALNLNFNMADAERFKKMNRINGEVSTEGTSKMLSSWKEDTPRKDQRAQLKSALVEAKLAGIADEYFGGEEMRAKRVRQTYMETPDEEDDALPHPLLAPHSPHSPRALAYLALMQEHLERRYTKNDRFSDDINLQKRDFRPVLRGRSGGIFRAMENSRHDIFTSSTAGQQSRRKLVSGNNTAKNTGLCHSLAYDWATQEPSSLLSEKQILFEISASHLKWNQTIEGAIKDQLFSGFDEVDDVSIRQLLTDMPDAITILIDGFDGKHVRNYGDNIMDVLKGRALQEVTVMVTSGPRSAHQLHRMAPRVYDHIDMQ